MNERVNERKKIKETKKREEENMTECIQGSIPDDFNYHNIIQQAR
jgi:hypothetical protein